ncbi:MAG: hypothetical protein GYA23_08710 [Methanomicrobiales archaeon]|nr:hypothetical protein [Methanomicrobiales archaeon]
MIPPSLVDPVTESRENKALIFGGTLAVIAANLAFIAFHSDKRTDTDILILVFMVCTVSIIVFAMSYSIARYFLLKPNGRDVVSTSDPSSLPALPFLKQPAVKGFFALVLAGAGIALYLYQGGSVNGRGAFALVCICALLGAPLVAFLNNTFGERRNEMPAVTLYLAIIILMFLIRFFWPLIFTGDPSGPVAWIWLIIALLGLVVFLCIFVPGIFSRCKE